MTVGKSKKIKTAIVVLAVLLAVSICALAVTVVYNRVASGRNVTVTVPDNLITPSGESSALEESENADGAIDNIEKPSVTSSTATVTSENTVKKTASTVKLFAKHPGDNTSFSFENMFPGDRVEKNFCVKVSYSGKVTVHYNAKLRSGDEELLRALNIRIKILSEQDTLYDGPIAYMPTSVTHELFSAEPAEAELYYQITAYIPETAGNEYQSKAVVADFSWWAEEKENLLPSPATGDTSATAVWAGVASASLLLFVLLVFIPKKKGDEENA